MKLNEWDYSVLYPQFNQKEYEFHIRAGRKIAKEKSCLIYSRGQLPSDLLLATQELFNYSEHRGNIDSNLIAKFDLCLCVDHRLRWWNTDGILNSLGWMKELSTSTIVGLVLQKSLGKARVLNYPRFATEFQGDKFHWRVGDLPMRVCSWNNLIALYDLKKDSEAYFNPSLVGLV